MSQGVGLASCLPKTRLASDLQERVGYSAFVSIGSMLDVGWGDLIDYFGDDPNTKKSDRSHVVL